MSDAPRSSVALAFAAVYLLWGSTYLFIKFTVASIPPLGMAGVRFLLAGAILYAYGRARGQHPPRDVQWRSAALVGTMLMVSNAAVAWSVQYIPSGVASLLVAITPCWMVLFDWRGHRDRRPTLGVTIGLLAGLGGILILVGPGSLMGGGGIDLRAALVVIAGTAIWSAGSLYARHAPRPTSPQLMSGMQMLCGGGVLTIVSAVTGQWRGFSPSATPAVAWWAFLYLVTCGSLVAYSAYMYLLTVTTPARVSTYAYVNPVVAVLLGWLFAGESLTPRVIVASAVIVGAVALIVTFSASAPPSRAPIRTDEHPIASPDAA